MSSNGGSDLPGVMSGKSGLLAARYTGCIGDRRNSRTESRNGLPGTEVHMHRHNGHDARRGVSMCGPGGLVSWAGGMSGAGPAAVQALQRGGRDRGFLCCSASPTPPCIR